MRYPLFEVDGNKMISLCGVTSYLWELFSQDLEQVEDNQSYFQSIEGSIVRNESPWAKFYHLNGKTWFNSMEKFDSNYIESVCDMAPNNLLFGPSYSDIDLYENYFVLNHKYYQVLSISSFMDQINYFDFENYNFCLMYEKLDPISAKSKLKLNRRMHFSSILKGIRDIESEKSYQESEKLLEELIVGQAGLIKAELFFIVDASSKAELDLKSIDLIKYIETLGGKLRIEGRGLGFFLSSLIPGVTPSMKRSSIVPSGYLSELIPLNRDSLMNSGFKLSSIRGSDIYFDLFDQMATNYNVLITGTSGQGKSMIANKLIKEELAKGSRGVILDLGNSFKKNVLYHGGEIFSEKFNPFQFKSITYLKAFIIAASGKDWTVKEEGILYASIKENLGDSSSMKELILLLDNSIPGIKYYFSEIEMFFTDEEKKISNLMYCDLTSYPELIKAPLMVYLIEYFNNIDGNKIFVFDECWNLLRNNSNYIAECFRTFRKSNASAIAISQNLDDFSETQLGRVIIQNTFYKFLFRQSIDKTPFLTDFQISKLNVVKSLKGAYSEFLILSEELQKVTRYYASPLEYELFTTSKSDNDYLDHYFSEKGRFLNYVVAFNNYVDIKYPFFKEIS